MLDRYFGRTRIECVFKTTKDYLDLLPLNKWSVECVRGKILNDVVSLIVYLGIRRGLVGSPLSIPGVLSRSRSIQCSLGPDGNTKFNLQVPAVVDLGELASHRS